MNIRPIPIPSNLESAKVFKYLANFDNCATRLSIGLGALCVEPLVDYYSNRNLSTEDRKYSVVKTCSKIFIGTATGVTARFLGQAQGREYLLKLINNEIKPLVLNAAKTPEFKKAVEGLTGKEKNQIPEVVKKVMNEIKLKKIYIHDEVLNDMMKEIVTKAKEVSIGNDKTIIASGKKLADSFGDAVGVATAALFCLTLDIPLMNLAMNKIMSVIHPKTKEAQQKGGN